MVVDLDAQPTDTRNRADGRVTMAATNPETAISRTREHETTEETRWILALGAPFAVAATFFMAAVGTGITWMIIPAIVAGPGAGVIALVFLALSSDTNELAATTVRAVSSSQASTA